LKLGTIGKYAAIIAAAPCILENARQGDQKPLMWCDSALNGTGTEVWHIAMFDTWTKTYDVKKGRTSLAGWRFESEAESKTYFAKRVKSKIQQSDSTNLLQEYLVEMADTGFEAATLNAQVDSPPLAKDWEIGEAFAEVILEDRFDASFPWPTSWDKRTPKASLPGPDITGFYQKNSPRFLFGEVKSSSEEKSPPQVARSGDDCLSRQVKRLVTSGSHRQQSIGWLLVRVKDSPRWKTVFDEALRRYADGEACVCGILVRGGIEPTTDDLSPVQDDLTDSSGTFDVMLLVFYLPFEKSKWVEIVYGREPVK
jgi:hypothetical protein